MMMMMMMLMMMIMIMSIDENEDGLMLTPEPEGRNPTISLSTVVFPNPARSHRPSRPHAFRAPLHSWGRGFGNGAFPPPTLPRTYVCFEVRHVAKLVPQRGANCPDQRFSLL